jgi:hypothetical protein
MPSVFRPSYSRTWIAPRRYFAGETGKRRHSPSNVPTLLVTLRQLSTMPPQTI